MGYRKSNSKLNISCQLRSADLEAQQRYSAYRAILFVAIVSQKYFVLVFVGYRTIIARYVAKWGIAQMCLCETSRAKGGYRMHFGGVLTLPEKVSRDMGYRSDSIAVSRDMGPLRSLETQPSGPSFTSDKTARILDHIKFTDCYTIGSFSGLFDSKRPFLGRWEMGDS